MPIRRTICVLAWLALSGTTLLAGVNRWTPGTPNWGPEFVTSVAVHPRNPDVVFARGDGLWRSDDGGTTWTRLDLSQSFALALALDPRSERVLYVDAKGGGVLRSTDGGRTWPPAAAPGTSPPSVYDLTIAPSAPDTLFSYAFGPENGVYRSRDSGATWQLVLPSLYLVGIAVDPSDADLVYAAASNQGVLKSTDGGDHWAASNAGLLALRADAIAVDSQDSRLLYLANAGLVFRSTDGGATWLPAVPGVPNPQQIEAVPGVLGAAWVRTNDSGGGGIFRTTNGGETWTAVPRPSGPSSMYSIAPDPGRAGSLYVAASALMKTANAGTTWTTLGVGPPQIAGFALAVSPFDAETVYAGGGLAHFSPSLDSGRTWLSPPNEDFDSLSINNLAVAPTSPEVVYAGTNNGILRTLNRGATWERVGERSDSTRVILDASQPSNLIAVTTVCPPRFFCQSFSRRSTDGGAAWSDIETTGGLALYARVLAPTTPPILLGTSDEGFVRGAPAGPLEVVPNAPVFPVLAVDPLEPSAIYGVGWFQGGAVTHFFQSGDVGSTWRPVASLPNWSFRDIAIDPVTPTHMALVTIESGVLRSTDGGATWASFNEDLPETDILSVAFSSDGRTLYAGTRHAVYEYTFCAACPPRLDPERLPTRIVAPRLVTGP